MSEWGGDRVMKLRARWERQLPQPCGQCARPVDGSEPWVIGHVLSRAAYPELTWVEDNHRVEHKACSNRSGHDAKVEKAARAGGLSGRGGGPKPPPFFPHTHRTSPGRPEPDLELPEELAWPNALRSRTETPDGYPAGSVPEWLAPYLEVPDDASPPLAMTPPHPDAVGSYGADAIRWMETHLQQEFRRGEGLRFWQKLVVARVLEHRADGSLCWPEVVLSASRRSGKSVLLRGLALWRITHAEDLFGEPSLILHTGRDVAVVREIHRKAWAWAEKPERKEEGYKVSRGVGQEEVIKDEVNRWLVRSTSSIYGYDVSNAWIDEAWDVEPQVLTEGLEPAALERESPQIALVSTAHRRATSLMKSRIADGLQVDPAAGPSTESLLLLWAPIPGSDVSKLATWKQASPHWNPQREKLITSKYKAAVAGEIDPEADEVDPMEAFTAQYLNMWQLRAKRTLPGHPLVTADEWEDLAVPVPAGTPQAVAVESWFNGSVSVAQAWHVRGRAVVKVDSYPTVSAAAAAAKAAGAAMAVRVGKSVAADPAFAEIWTEPMATPTKQAVMDMRRLLDNDQVRHASSDSLTEQVLAVRTRKWTDGIQLVSKESADALKSAVWAAVPATQTVEAPAIF